MKFKLIRSGTAVAGALALCGGAFEAAHLATVGSDLPESWVVVIGIAIAISVTTGLVGIVGHWTSSQVMTRIALGGSLMLCISIALEAVARYPFGGWLGVAEPEGGLAFAICSIALEIGSSLVFAITAFALWITELPMASYRLMS